MLYRYCAALCKVWARVERAGRSAFGRLLAPCLLLACMLLPMSWHAHARGNASDLVGVDRPARPARPAPGDSSALTYPAIAAAFRLRTAGPATPAPAIAALARRLTDGVSDPRARALALSDWVRLHVRPAGADMPLPGDAVRSAAAVLASLSGNGPDRAMLLQALLTAVGIDNTAALVRLAGDATLPDAPTPATFDHVLVHVPSLDLYLDPSSPTTAAGYLPPALLGKPALLVATGRFGMTPLAQPQAVRSSTTIDVQRDGSAAFRVERTYAGALAEPVRKAMGEAPPAVRTAFVRQVAVDLGRRGHAALDATWNDARVDAHADANGDARVVLSGLAERVVDPATARRLATTYPHLSAVGEAVAAMRGAAANGPLRACPAVDVEDELHLRLPPRMRIVHVPEAVDVIDGGVFYRAAYARQGNAVVVRRRLTFRNGRPACTPAEFAAMRATLDRVARDLGSQVVIAAR